MAVTLKNVHRATLHWGLLGLPTLYRELLGPAITANAAQTRTIVALPELLDALSSAISLCNMILVKHFFVCGAVIHSVIAAITKPGPSTGIPAHSSMVSWVTGMLSIFLGIASITTSMFYLNSMLFVQSRTDKLLWLQNASRNESSAWKNLPALLAVPSAFCLWSLICFVIHALTWSANEAPGFHLEPVLPWSPWLERYWKQVLVGMVALIWGYTISAIRAVIDLSELSVR
ncbi:hypothetical protein BDW22DRAFT_153009 [Trametopsis cervina]|nr:hypothetical protein BDW22DRAFT_153009 [Trametopsis cervina]